MLSDIAHQAAQSALRQRNGLLGLCALLIVLCICLVLALLSRNERVILVPTLSARVGLSASRVSPDYLELVTRDVAYLMLNRSPSGLDYWMEEILALVHPSAHGPVKSELVKLISEQRGSDVSQSFRLMQLRVDPSALTSEVSGELATIVGRQVVAKARRTYRLTWRYGGLRLWLMAFEDITPPDTQEAL